MKDLQSLVVENIVIWLPALERGQGEFYDAFLMGDGGVEEKYGCVELWGGRWKLRIGGKEDTGQERCFSIFWRWHTGREESRLVCWWRL